MELQKSCLSFSLNPDFSLKIELGIYEKEVILNRFKEYLGQHNKMGNWLDDPKVPMQQKEPYIPHFMNLMDTLNFLIKFLKYAGIPESEITEMLNIPF